MHDRTANSAKPPHLTEGVLAEFVLGKLPDTFAADVERHLADCPECQGRAAAASPSDPLLSLIAVVGSRPAPGSTLLAGLESTFTELTRAGHVAGPGKIPAADLTPPPGLTNHPRYRLVRPLGRGGMGVVWLAEHMLMGRMVALKMIHPAILGRPGALDRFRREVRAAAQLHHPNVVAAYDADEVEGAHVLVMEYVPGETLLEEVRRGPLSPADACRAARDAARGLAHAHAAGLVHRDVKPGNLIRDLDGTVKVMDFGLVGITADESGLTGENIVMGTPDYIAPEQADDATAADARSDVYALGCTLYHLLSGRVPYLVASTLRKLDAHRDPAARPAPLPGLPAALAGVLATMLATKPADRYASADAVAEALAPFAEGTSAPVAARSSRGRIATLAVLGLVALVAATIVFIAQKNPSGSTGQPGGSSPTHEIREVRQFPGLTETVMCAQFSPDGQHVAGCGGGHWYKDQEDASGTDFAIRIWEVSTSRLVHTLRGHRSLAYSLAFSPDGKLLASTSSDCTVRIWDLRTGAAGAVLTFPFTPPGVAFTPDGRHVLATSWGSRPRLFEAATGREVKEFHPELPKQDWLTSAYSPDGRTLVIGGAGLNPQICVVNAATGKRVRSLSISHRLKAVHFTFDGSRLLTLNQGRGPEIEDWRVHVWNPSDWTETAAYPATAAAFQGRSGRRILTANATDNRILIRNTDTGETVGECVGHTGTVYYVSVSPDGRYAVSGAGDNTVRLWELPQLSEP